MVDFCTTLQTASMACHNSTFEENIFPFLKISCLTIPHKFSMQFRSGDAGGQFINWSSPMFFDAKNCFVERDAWAGTLSCINTNFRLKVLLFNLCHNRKFSDRNCSEFILTPSGTLYGPKRVSPTIPAQNITPPPISCLLSWFGAVWSWRIHPFNQPPGKSIVDRHSSVKRT